MGLQTFLYLFEQFRKDFGTHIILVSVEYSQEGVDACFPVSSGEVDLDINACNSCLEIPRFFSDLDRVANVFYTYGFQLHGQECTFFCLNRQQVSCHLYLFAEGKNYGNDGAGYYAESS